MGMLPSGANRYELGRLGGMRSVSPIPEPYPSLVESGHPELN